jgi:tetratricopeptide (TPR) repeat protein
MDTAPTPAPATQPIPGATAPDPQSVDALNDLALIRIREQFPTEGKAAALKALALNPQSAAAWFNLGRALLDLHQLPEAREALPDKHQANLVVTLSPDVKIAGCARQ